MVYTGILGFFCSILCAAQLWGAAQDIVYLTWMHDPCTTMTVQWHSLLEEKTSEVFYQKVGETVWHAQGGAHTPLNKSNYLVHTVELCDLSADTEYRFRIADHEEIYLFQTLPDSLVHSLKFIVGGDAYFHLSTFRKMNAQIAKCDPAFVVVGGDIAYTNGMRSIFKGKEWEINRWRTFLKEWKAQMVTSKGHLIPLMPVLGNHDVRGATLKSMSQHYLFYELFALAEDKMPYRTMDVGNYLSLFLLDSGHTHHIGGQQTQWLKNHLSARENTPYKMAVYHIAAYPSVYSFKGNGPAKIRSDWCTLFEQYHLQVAFENHNHAYKRTYPMKGTKIDADGVIYMGDGSWGVTPRKQKSLWYLNVKARTNAVCMVTLTKENAHVDAINLSGETIDTLMIMPQQSTVAWNERQLVENF